MTARKRLAGRHFNVRADDLRMPPAAGGMRIGLFGGSFDPPHGGHALVAETALRALGLDALWWIVTPGNPLKDTSGLAPLAERIAASRALNEDPRVVVTAFEAGHRIRYTADMLRLVTGRHPSVRFVWVMGADNLTGFHRWQEWEWIAHHIPIAIIDRPGSTLPTIASRFALRFARDRLDESDARALPSRAPPAWVFLHGPRSGLSSTAIRAARTGGAIGG